MKRSSLILSGFFWIVFVFFIFSGPFNLHAVDEIKIDNVAVEKQSSTDYVISGVVSNTSDLAREIVLRVQLSFYERVSPPGDLPAAILRKDMTLVLKPAENRTLRISLYNEGSMILPTAYRLEPILRIRRQRPWNY